METIGGQMSPGERVEKNVGHFPPTDATLLLLLLLLVLLLGQAEIDVENDAELITE